MRFRFRGCCPQRPILDRATVQALIRISQAGCGASMIFLAFTVLLYAALRWVTPPHPMSPSCPESQERCRLESTLLVQHYRYPLQTLVSSSVKWGWGLKCVRVISVESGRNSKSLKYNGEYVVPVRQPSGTVGSRGSKDLLSLCFSQLCSLLCQSCQAASPHSGSPRLVCLSSEFSKRSSRIKAFFF